MIVTENNEFVLSLFLNMTLPATRICCWAPAPAARRPQISIDISYPQGTRQQTRQPP